MAVPIATCVLSFWVDVRHRFKQTVSFWVDVRHRFKQTVAGGHVDCRRWRISCIQWADHPITDTAGELILWQQISLVCVLAGI